MSLQVTSLSELSSEQVLEALEIVKQLLQEEHPEAYVRTGVISGLLLLTTAQHLAAAREEIDRVRRSSSLLAVSADPTLAVDDVVDRVLSNYRITRQAGAAATGEVTIVVSQLATVTVPSGAVFEGDGQQFTADSAYVARTSAANVLSDSDRVLSATADGQYSFNIDVTAVAAGAAGMLDKDTALTPQTQLVNFVRAYAASDFVGGVDQETNSQLLAQAQAGLAAEGLSGRANMLAALRKRYPTVVGSSIIGYGDAEMLRDQHSVLPVSFGGRVDWYVRTQQLPQRVGLTKTATLISKTVDGFGVWQFSVGRDEVPGFYDVTEIRLTGALAGTGYEIVQEVRSSDLTSIAGELLPDIETTAESAFSRYQATVVQFKDDDTSTGDLALGATQDYDVTVRGMPNIASIQTSMSSRSLRNYGGDVLIKAPVPCFVSLSFVLEGQSGASLPDAHTVKAALASYVNNLGFTGRLAASAVLDVIHDYLSGGLTVVSLDMVGEILRPDGTLQRLRSGEVLIIPDESGRMVSARTVGFMLDPDDVLISARAVNIPEI